MTNMLTLASVKQVIILGMHRSGTSCLAGSLEAAGLYLGNVDRHGQTNPKGNRENRNIMHLHDNILSRNGASWSNPPKSTINWMPEHLTWRDKIISQHPIERTWGFKDPRTLFLLDGWLDALPNSLLFATLRHPYCVALSLQKRNGFSVKKGLELWLSYNKQLLNICLTRQVTLISFDSPPELYRQQISYLCERAGLSPLQERDCFFNQNFRHNYLIDAPQVEPCYASLYHQLRERAEETHRHTIAYPPALPQSSMPIPTNPA